MIKTPIQKKKKKKRSALKILNDNAAQNRMLCHPYALTYSWLSLNPLILRTKPAASLWIESEKQTNKKITDFYLSHRAWHYTPMSCIVCHAVHCISTKYVFTMHTQPLATAHTYSMPPDLRSNVSVPGVKSLYSDYL